VISGIAQIIGRQIIVPDAGIIAHEEIGFGMAAQPGMAVHGEIPEMVMGIDQGDAVLVGLPANGFHASRP
jgi:hypothetical protein